MTFWQRKKQKAPRKSETELLMERIEKACPPGGVFSFAGKEMVMMHRGYFNGLDYIHNCYSTTYQSGDGIVREHVFSVRDLEALVRWLETPGAVKCWCQERNDL